MKKILIAVAVSALFAGQVIATEGKDHSSHGKKGRGNSTTSTSSSGSFSAAGAVAGSASLSSATGGNASALGGAGGQGGSSSASIAPMNFNFTAPAQPAVTSGTTTLGGKVTVRQAPDVSLQLGSPTSNCMNVLGFGGSNASGGGLISFSVGVDWCKGFEMARQAKNHGLDTLAEDLICAVEEVKALNSRDCFGARKRAEEAAQEKAATSQQAPNPAFQSN